MAVLPANKADNALKNIREVCDLLQVETHVIRYWEQRFPWITPVRRAGGRRYYRKDDVELLQIIKILLKDEGLSIRGAQKLIRETSRQNLVQSWLKEEDNQISLGLEPEEEDTQAILPLEVDENTINLPAKQKRVLREVMDELVNIHILLKNEKISLP